MNELDLINGLSGVTLENYIAGLGEAEKVALIKAQKMQNKNSGGRGTSREEFIKRLGLLDPKLQAGVVNGTIRFADIAYYVVKSVSGAISMNKMFKDDDNKVTGISNVSRGQLEKDNVFMLDKIILLGGANANTTDPGDVNFEIIDAKIRNGEFIFKANGSEIIPLTSCEIFDTESTNSKKGSYKLANPVLIQSQKAMELEIVWKTAATTNYWLKAVLMGTVLYKK